MQRLALELGTERSKLRRWTAVPALLLAIAAAAQIGLFASLRREAAQLNAATRDAAAQAAKTAGPESVEIQTAREIGRQLNVPWESLFAALEAVTVDGIEMRSIQSDPKQGKVTIVAWAGDLEEILRYVKALSAHPPFSGVYLSHHTVRERQQGGGLEFVLEASW